MTRAKRETSRAVRSDLTWLRGNEQLVGRETLGTLAVSLARSFEDARAAGDSLAETRYARELRAVLAALGRPEDTTDDRAWLRELSTPLGDTPQP